AGKPPSELDLQRQGLKTELFRPITRVNLRAPTAVWGASKPLGLGCWEGARRRRPIAQGAWRCCQSNGKGAPLRRLQAIGGVGDFMKPLSFKRHRFPAEVIRHAVWLYFRFSLSFRDVEELMAQRGIDVSYETIRCWTIKFGPLIARRLKKRRVPPTGRWHLDEMVCKI